jgi:hypothetical protein
MVVVEGEGGRKEKGGELKSGFILSNTAKTVGRSEQRGQNVLYRQRR